MAEEEKRWRRQLGLIVTVSVVYGIGLGGGRPASGAAKRRSAPPGRGETGEDLRSGAWHPAWFEICVNLCESMDRCGFGVWTSRRASHGGRGAGWRVARVGVVFLRRVLRCQWAVAGASVFILFICGDSFLEWRRVRYEPQGDAVGFPGEAVCSRGVRAGVARRKIADEDVGVPRGYSEAVDWGPWTHSRMRATRWAELTGLLKK